jgi:glycine/D-amino acid oxidase-like deaminating enzyme
VSAVESVTEGGDGRRWKVETPRGSVRCTHVVYATNAYTPALLPQFSGRTTIVPTRGQAIAIRAAVPARELTLSAFTANYQLEYWFVRPGSAPKERPLVILGGARHTKGSFHGATTDDSIVDPAVGRRLREFLPEVFPGKFEKGAEPEMEWVRPYKYLPVVIPFSFLILDQTGIMGYTKLGDPFVRPCLVFWILA